MARHKTKMVRSMMDVYKMRLTLGLRWGGSPNVSADASPSNTVLDNIHEARNVNATPINTTPTTVPAAMKEVRAGGKEAATKTVASIIKVGKRPLHGTKLFVRMAINRSRGESITRVAITPAALHPNPMAMVRDCFPCAPVFLNIQSRLNATRGKI